MVVTGHWPVVKIVVDVIVLLPNWTTMFSWKKYFHQYPHNEYSCWHLFPMFHNDDHSEHDRPGCLRDGIPNPPQTRVCPFSTNNILNRDHGWDDKVKKWKSHYIFVIAIFDDDDSSSLKRANGPNRSHHNHKSYQAPHCDYYNEKWQTQGGADNQIASAAGVSVIKFSFRMMIILMMLMIMIKLMKMIMMNKVIFVDVDENARRSDCDSLFQLFVHG